VLALALLWRLALWVSVSGTPLATWHEWGESDMATFVAQARQIAAGDLLIERPVFPYHAWMKGIPEAEWERWRPHGMLYRPPLYSYLLAVPIAVGVPLAPSARAAHLALGLVACWLTWTLATRLLGRTAGVVAGALVAVYGPLLVVESQLLRDGPMLVATVAVLWLAARCLHGARAARRSAGAWAAGAATTGAALGAMTTLHDGAALLAVAVAASGAAFALRRRTAADAARWAAALALGCLAGYAPLLARNLLTGAPLGPRTFASVEAFATANHPDVAQPPAATIFTNRVPERPEAFAALMRDAQGRVGRIAAGVARAWGPRWRDWARRYASRVLALLAGPESNENLSHDYFRRRAPVLRVSLGFRFLLPAAVAGAGVLLAGRRRRLLAGPLGLVAAQGALFFAMVTVVHPFGRYRLMFLPVLAMLAGLAAARLRLALRARRWRPAVAVVALAALAAVAQGALDRRPLFAAQSAPRSAEYVVAAYAWARAGDLDAAAREIGEGLALAPDDPQLRAARAAFLALLRQRHAAAPDASGG